jgi:hypothetical protein
LQDPIPSNKKQGVMMRACYPSYVGSQIGESQSGPACTEMPGPIQKLAKAKTAGSLAQALQGMIQTQYHQIKKKSQLPFLLNSTLVSFSISHKPITMYLVNSTLQLSNPSPFSVSTSLDPLFVISVPDLSNSLLPGLSVMLPLLHFILH